MHYPWWYVPYLTAPMLIAAVSVLHVLVAHYAVGGGLFLAVEISFAYRQKNAAYLAYLRRHTKFFVVLTLVLGAMTGVGIWWTIGLASPLATHMLLRILVFAWATEYVFFLLEIVSAFAFYYYWGRLPEKVHSRIVWIYGLSAWASLVIISAITAFMLDPGGWNDQAGFWTAILNRQALPQIIARTGGALMLSSLYVYLHSSLVMKDETLRRLVERRSTRPALLGAVLITAGGIWWYLTVPQSARVVIEGAAVLNVLMALLFVATGVVFVLLYLGPYRNPGWTGAPGFAAALLFFGMIGFSTGEFIREAVRKPWIVYHVVLGNQIFPTDVYRLRSEGFLEGGTWTKPLVRSRYPEVFDSNGRIDRRRLLGLPHADRVALGGVIFQYHCNDCHAQDRGYSAVGPLVQGWSRETVLATIKELDHTRVSMPPWSGTPEEAELLADYLRTIAPPPPGDAWPDEVPK